MFSLSLWDAFVAFLLALLISLGVIGCGDAAIPDKGFVQNMARIEAEREEAHAEAMTLEHEQQIETLTEQHKAQTPEAAEALDALKAAYTEAVGALRMEYTTKVAASDAKIDELETELEKFGGEVEAIIANAATTFDEWIKAILAALGGGGLGVAGAARLARSGASRAKPDVDKLAERVAAVELDAARKEPPPK